MPLLTPDPFPELPDWTPKAETDGELKWRVYEKIVGDTQAMHRNCVVIQDHKIKGVRSGVIRQIDVWVTGEIAGHEIKLAIECKLHKAKVDIKTVDAFIGFLEDVAADKGVLITTTGFTLGAKTRAGAAGIELNVMTLESAMETDWGQFLEDSCKTWMRCLGSIHWDYSESGPRFGMCDHCGQLNIECGACGHQ